MKDCAFQFAIAADIKIDAARRLRKNFSDPDRLKDVLQEGIEYFATSRSAAKLAKASRKHQIIQLVQDCTKAAKEKLGGDFWTINEDRKWTAKNAKRTISTVHEKPEQWLNHAAEDKIEAFENKFDAVAQINSIVAFCKRAGLHDELVIISLKYNKDWTDQEIADYLGLTLNMVQKAYRRVGRLYREEQEKLKKAEAKNAKTPVAARVSGGSVVQL